MLTLLDCPPEKAVALDNEMSKSFLVTTLSELDGKIDILSEDHPGFGKLGVSGIILNDRLKLDNTKTTFLMAVFAVCYSKGIPGNVVQWAYAFNRLYHMKGKVSPVCNDDFAIGFPYGIPNDAFMLECWDSQKSYTDSEYEDRHGNILDRRDEWLNYEKPACVLPGMGEYLETTKQKALSLADSLNEPTKALVYFLTEIEKHPELRGHPVKSLVPALLMAGKLGDKEQIKSFINGTR